MKPNDYMSRSCQGYEPGHSVETGVFAAHMQIELLNDGPVTFVLDSRGATLRSVLKSVS